MMRVLLLSPYPDKLAAVLADAGDEAVVQHAPLDAPAVHASGAEFIVSHGYRHILRRSVLDLLPGRIVNLHISLLPHNRGADPNLWSFLEDSPKGVSIHHVDEGIDMGDLIAQSEMNFASGETLATTYEKLQKRIAELFADVWAALRSGGGVRRPQSPGGSFHRKCDKDPYMHLLKDGWNTPVDRLIGRALVRQG